MRAFVATATLLALCGCTPPVLEARHPSAQLGSPRSREATDFCLQQMLASPAIALQLARDARWRAIQSCRDLLGRLAGFMKLGNLAPLLEPEMTVVFRHRNTLSWCCTSFVNSGGPFLQPERPSLRSG
jgi:hypothetical protein